jgi:hypothetical protein
MSQQDDMAFSLPAVAKLMKTLGTTTRQTKCKKVANPLLLRDYFLVLPIVIVPPQEHPTAHIGKIAHLLSGFATFNIYPKSSKTKSATDCNKHKLHPQRASRGKTQESCKTTCNRFK